MKSKKEIKKRRKAKKGSESHQSYQGRQVQGGFDRRCKVEKRRSFLSNQEEYRYVPKVVPIRAHVVVFAS
jgi:hypothetical protein